MINIFVIQILFNTNKIYLQQNLNYRFMDMVLARM